MRAVQLSLLPMLVGLACAGQAAATTVAINRPNIQITALDTLVLGAKYRMSRTNFDQSLDSGGGTSNVPGGPNFIQRDLGNNGDLNNRTYGFSLRNIAGQGVVFSMTSPSNSVSSLAWGDFAPALSPVPGSAASQLRAHAATGQTPGSMLSPGQLPMNILHLEVTSLQRSGQTYSPTVTLTNLAFAATGVATRGTMITAQTVTPATTLSNPNFKEVGPGWASQWLVTNGNFWAFDWTISGNVNLAFTGSPSQVDEFVKFAISGKQGVFTGAVPEPEAWLMLIVGFGLVGAAIRRDRGDPWGAFA